MNNDQEDILRFYRGEAGNSAGHTLDEILGWTNGQLEMDHDYIQFCFPSNEPSRMNSAAPTLNPADCVEFQNDPYLRARMYRALERILDFFGFRISEREEMPVIELLDGSDTRPDPQAALRFFNHNMLRVTRVLKSLRLCGMECYAAAFYEALRPWEGKVSGNTWGYWTRAAKGPLWREEMNEAR